MTLLKYLPDWRTALRGGLIYAGGDTTASLISGEFQVGRSGGMLLLGATLYATEIPIYFGWLERRFGRPGRANALKKAVLAQLFFNPLWIARHLAFICWFSGNWAEVDWYLLAVGLRSFAYMLPVGLMMNYAIQNKVPLASRFFASALYSALTSVYFALSGVWFG